MSKSEGNRVPGRWDARRIRRRPAGGRIVPRVYHHRMRDGQRVVWSEDGDGDLRLLAPYEGEAPLRRIAYRILAGAVGKPRALRLAEPFEALLGTFGPRWDWTDEHVREWAEWAEKQPWAGGD